MPATGVPVRTGNEGCDCAGTRPWERWRAFSKEVNRKKFALYEKVMSFSPFGPSYTRSSTIGGGSTGRRSAEAGQC